MPVDRRCLWLSDSNLTCMAPASRVGETVSYGMKIAVALCPEHATLYIQRRQVSEVSQRQAVREKKKLTQTLITVPKPAPKVEFSHES
jgi:hypothetical protein